MGARAGEILAKTAVAALLCLIAWTIVASLVFLAGTRLLHAFPHPFWQWWLYFFQARDKPVVDKWLKLGAAAGLVMPVLMLIAVLVRRQNVARPRRSLFGGVAAAAEAATDNYGRARWMAVPINQMREVLKGIHATSKSAVARDYAGALMEQVPETFAGIYGSADKESAWLANKAFAALVSGKSFKSSDLIGGKMDVFLKMPLEALDTAPALARTVIGALLNTAYQANGNFDGRILYLLDEVARLGYMRIIE